jgi:hypothetical protein
VFVDGVNQYGPGAQYAYLETDGDTVTFVNGLHVGALVKFTTSQLNSSASQSDAFQVSYTPPFTGSVATSVGNKLAQTVSVKDFGAVGDGVTDDTTAIQAALNTGKNIYFPAGVYMHTGGIQQLAQGQHIYGDGIQLLPQPTYPIGNATILKKISGTSFGWQLESHNGGIHNISFDNAGFAGPALKVTGHYLVVENICMANVGGTDYAMLLESVNVSYFRSILFQENNYACIGTNGVDACLYSEFHKVYVGEINSTTYGVNLSGCNNVSFYDMSCEVPMFIGDSTQNLNFFNFSSEAYTNTATPLITIEGTTLGGEAPININIDSARIISGAARTSEVIKVKNAKNINIEDVQWVDLVSASPVFCTIDGAQGFTLQNHASYVNATTDVVQSIFPGTLSQSVRLENIYQVNSNQLLYLQLYSAGNLSVVNSAVYVNFLGSFAGSRYLFENVSGTIDTTNILSTVYVLCNNCTSVNDAAEVATLSNCVLTNGLFVQSGKTVQTTLTLTAAATASWVGVVTGDKLIKSVHTLNKTAITGAVGFTGYSVGYTAAAGTNVTAFGSNLSPSNGASNGLYDYSITSPIYGPDNANQNVILTAVGGNFATGSIKLCMIYEKFNVMTS